MACLSFSFSFSVDLLKCHNFLNTIAERKENLRRNKKILFEVNSILKLCKYPVIFTLTPSDDSLERYSSFQDKSKTILFCLHAAESL